MPHDVSSPVALQTHEVGGARASLPRGAREAATPAARRARAPGGRDVAAPGLGLPHPGTPHSAGRLHLRAGGLAPRRSATIWAAIKVSPAPVTRCTMTWRGVALITPWPARPSAQGLPPFVTRTRPAPRANRASAAWTAVVALGKRKRAVISPVRIQRNLGVQKNPEVITQERAMGESRRQLPRHLRRIRDPGKAVRVGLSRLRRRRFRFSMWMSKRSLPRRL